jgi:hypothetical protein
VTVAIPEPFFAISSHTPGDVVWCFESHAFHCACDANAAAGSESFVAGDGFLLDTGSQ